MTRSDGYLDEIHSLRNQYEADVCVLLVNTLDNHGYAASTGAEFNDAFCVVRASSAVSYYTFPHELGHLFGCRHDSDSGIYPYSNAHGYNWHGRLFSTTRYYKTIMSIEEPTKYLRVQYFSNPDVLDELNNPMGTLSTNYCAYAIDDYASTLAALEPYYTTAGTMNVNEWWNGTVNVSGNVTIANGVSLTIASGTQINYASGASLIVNGTLTASGTSSSPITFNFTSPNSTTQNGIIFNSGSSGTINYCQIRNAYRGIYESGVNINITNSAISGCTNGIYLYNSSPTIQGCNIHDNPTYGINMLYSSSSTVLKENYIQNNGVGVYCSASSYPVIGNNSSPQKGNHFSSNSIGILAYNNSIPVIGNGSSGGYNNLLNSSYNVLNSTSNTIYAYNNWWGTTTPANFLISGTVSYSPYLSSTVSITTPSLSKTSGSLLASADEEIPMFSELDKAYELAASNNMTEARGICMKLINNYPDYSVSFNALNLLKETYSDAELNSKKDIYKSLFNQKSKKDLYAMAGLMLSEIDKENRLKYIDEVIETYKGENIVEYALFDKFIYNNFELNDKENALAISKELDEQFPESLGSIEAHRILGDEEYYDIDLSKKLISQKTKNTVPTELLLIDNYPNPFNPSTTISYTLPEAGAVQIKIYDILGREVSKLVDEQKSAGKYSVQWNGINYASGIYFYSVTFGGQRLYKKMLMIK
jgi:parallel beta-helix repeat protein